jgi:hypothetical protein
MPRSRATTPKRPQALIAARAPSPLAALARVAWRTTRCGYDVMVDVGLALYGQARG